jgi:tetratricopeptide (TPR) repeat protein
MRDALAAGFPAQVLPELGASGGEPGNLGATFEAAARYLRALAGSRGALVVLEDLHWADATSLSLVPFLARALQGSPVSLLLTYRPGDDDRPAPALEGLRSEMLRSRLGHELPLGPLAPEDAAAMLTEVFGRRPAPDVETELLRLAGGNPFALEELARAVVDSGWLDLESGRRRGTSSVSVPWTLAESIRARAERLAPADRELIEWTAAIGGRFDARLLAAASERTPEDTLGGVARLVQAGLVVEAPGDGSGHLFAFRHTLVHEALSQEGLRAQRRGRHARVLAAAEAMLAEGTLEVSAAELARHAMAAGDRERTLRHSRAAVARAQELGAVREAVEHLERALSLWSEEDGRGLRAELLFACGRLRVRLARGDERAVELLGLAVDEYEGLGDEPTALWCLSVLADARFEAGDRTQALLDWERSVPELRRLGPPEALRTALGGYSRGLALSGRMAPAADAADEGLALVPVAHDSSDAAERTNLLITRGLVELFRYRWEPGRALILEAIDLAMAHHDDVGAARGHHIFAAGQPLLLPVAESLTR